MRIEEFAKIVEGNFWVGVPDSLLKPLCDYLMNTYGINKQHHLIAANEGNAVGIAAGYQMATGKYPIVYMQNSGEGNIINPVVSLLNEKIYAIPMVFVIGWRGEPGEKDEPQHMFQGEITEKLLEDIKIPYFIISSNTTIKQLMDMMREFKKYLLQGQAVAFLVRKGAFVYEKKCEYTNNNAISREKAIEKIVQVVQEAPIITTTGKISRELYEVRERNGQSHAQDFLTVGSMGHCSSIALGVAIGCTTKQIWCIDGDGAVLMHMGALAVIGQTQIANMIHIVLNNEAHESVGGMPTAMKSVSICEVARACGYQYVSSVKNTDELERELDIVRNNKCLSFLEIKCSTGSRKNLGRPLTKPIENKKNFEYYISE